MIRRLLFFFALFLTAALLPSNAAWSQELTPRAYWPLPKGTNALVLAYQYSSGDIIIDQSLDIAGVDSDIHYFQFTYQNTFSLLGRTANIQLSLPYSDSETMLNIGDSFAKREISGMPDSQVRMAINLKGAPSMDAAGFQALRADPKTIIGASVLLHVPSGEYEPDKVINLGTNRWALKPAVGVIWPMHHKWLLEFEVGAWFFEDNDNYLGQTREQEPVLSAEFHLIRRFRPGFWVSLDANFYTGGRSTINGLEQSNLQRNSKFGATLVIPIVGRHGIRGSFNTGVVTKSGGDYSSYSLSYLYAW